MPSGPKNLPKVSMTCLGMYNKILKSCGGKKLTGKFALGFKSLFD